MFCIQTWPDVARGFREIPKNANYSCNGKKVIVKHSYKTVLRNNKRSTLLKRFVILRNVIKFYSNQSASLMHNLCGDLVWRSGKNIIDFGCFVFGSKVMKNPINPEAQLQGLIVLEALFVWIIIGSDNISQHIIIKEVDGIIF